MSRTNHPIFQSEDLEKLDMLQTSCRVTFSPDALFDEVSNRQVEDLADAEQWPV